MTRQTSKVYPIQASSPPVLLSDPPTGGAPEVPPVSYLNLNGLAGRVATAMLGLLLLASCSSTPRLSETPTDDVDLSGRWVLDRDASDNPEEMIQTAMAIAQIERSASGPGSVSKGGGAMRSSGGSNGGRRGGGGQRGASRGGETGGRAMADPGGMVPNPNWIDIEQSVQLIEVNYGDQRFGRYPLNTPITEVSFAGRTETESGWSGTEFWTVTESERGITLIERYVLAPDGQELLLETQLDAKAFEDPVTIRRVFYPPGS